MRKSVLLLFILSFFHSFTSTAQDDFGMWGGISVEYKINKKIVVGVEGEYRSRNNVSESDRWSAGVNVNYKIMKHLKTGAGYTFLCDNVAKTKVYDEDDGGGVKWKQSYWQPRNRFYLQLTGDYDLGRFNVSLRERWQYTHRSASTRTVARSYYTEDGDYRYDKDKEIDISEKNKHVLRSRLQVAYNIRKCPVSPYCSVELTNGWALEKTRYTLGADWEICSHHTIGLQYLYQNVNGDDDDDVNSSIICISYNISL